MHFSCALTLILCNVFKVIYIYMRRDEDHSFKGSVFAEFSSADEANAFVGLEVVKYKEEELIKMMR